MSSRVALLVLAANLGLATTGCIIVEERGGAAPPHAGHPHHPRRPGRPVPPPPPPPPAVNPAYTGPELPHPAAPPPPPPPAVNPSYPGPALPHPAAPPATPPPAFTKESGHVAINVVGGACAIAVDGADQGIHQNVTLPISFGEHEISCILGRERQASRVNIRDLSTVPVEFRFALPTPARSIDVTIKR